MVSSLAILFTQTKLVIKKGKFESRFRSNHLAVIVAKF